MVKNSPKIFPTRQRKKWQNILQTSVANANRGAKISPSLSAVLDSNIWISAIVFGGNSEKTMLFCLEHGQIVISEDILTETTDYLRNFAGAPYKWLRTFRNSLEKLCLFVEPKTLDIPELRDQKDVHIIASASEGQCDFIITGDKDLLELEKYKKLQIVSPADFLQLPFVKKNF